MRTPPRFPRLGAAKGKPKPIDTRPLHQKYADQALGSTTEGDQAIVEAILAIYELLKARIPRGRV